MKYLVESIRTQLVEVTEVGGDNHYLPGETIFSVKAWKSNKEKGILRESDIEIRWSKLPTDLKFQWGDFQENLIEWVKNPEED